jgi:hypothetical protein
MLLVIMFFNHVFLGNIDFDMGIVSFMLYIFTGLYFVGGYLIKIGRQKQLELEKHNHNNKETKND